MSVPLSTPAATDRDRTISFFNLHTKERLTVTYMKDGRYDDAAMAKVNHMLRDWRRDQSIRMDPELIDLVYSLHEELGSKEPIGIVSGYRSPATNAKLRSRSRGVAKHSQHILGKAMDVWFPDVPLKRLREAALIHQEGGVGYYPTSGRPFVHVDTGRVRHWPRMPRTELARLFPDGNTLHIPADGKPLARKVKTRDVQVARAEAAAPRSAPKQTATPTRAIVTARADAAAPVANGKSDSEEGFSLSLFGYKEQGEPSTAQTEKARQIASLISLPEGSSAPLPTPRPVIELAEAGGEEELSIASLPQPEPVKEEPAKRPLALASLGPAPRAPAPEKTPLRTATAGIWADGLSYQPPSVDGLVVDWRVHGEAFASLTAPDQTHLAGLMQVPSQSLTIRFSQGPVEAPAAADFAGPAVAPLKVADLAAPLVTAAR